jgi:hypothetical protein
MRRRASCRMRARAVFFKRSATGVESGAVVESVAMEVAGGATGKTPGGRESGRGGGGAEEKKRREWSVAVRRAAERE